MILQKRHIIAKRVGNKFKEDLKQSHSEFLNYPLEYLKLKIAISEFFNIVIEELPELTLDNIRKYLLKFNLELPREIGDDNLELAGFMYISDNASFMFIEENDIEERKKFSLLHETSHFMNEYYQIKLKSSEMHTISLFEKDIRSESNIIIAKRCSKNDVFGQIYGINQEKDKGIEKIVLVNKLIEEKEKRENVIKERICDWFAAEVLMPVEIIKKMEEKWILRKYPYEEMVNEIHSFFKVSRQAANVRATELQVGVSLQEKLI
jgi:Zn-dependent peptidase ImmA (M78 family)